MSRLGKKPIIVPENTEVKMEGREIFVKGPLGELRRTLDDLIDVEIKDNLISLSPARKRGNVAALWGTYASIIKNMIEGVTKGFTKKLIIEGVGFRAEVKGDKLVLNLGFSHLVEMQIKKGVEVKAEKNKIQVFGVDKELVGQVSANIRALKKPEPYKGKGIRYEDEIIRRKAGKKAAGTS